MHIRFIVTLVVLAIASCTIASPSLMPRQGESLFDLGSLAKDTLVVVWTGLAFVLTTAGDALDSAVQMARKAKPADKNLPKDRANESTETRAEKRERLEKQADAFKLKKQTKLSGCNNKIPIYDAPTLPENKPTPDTTFISMDLLHGAWEALNRKGKHLGEFKYDGENWTQTKPADETGGHDIRMC
ncbi:hypothetical protein HDU97_005452 [Phlyctochytrium planicorne]|nr:hypothetical protein HDU97_005452 [Phlyctochytrium planicorne]